MEKNRIGIGAAQVHPLIARYMPMDGLDVVVDLEKSHGSQLYDAKTDRYRTIENVHLLNAGLRRYRSLSYNVQAMQTARSGTGNRLFWMC